MKTASKKGILYFCLALLGVAAAAVAAPAFAEDAKSAGLNPDDLKKALGLSIYLQGGYTYNGNASDSGPFDDTAKGEQNDLRIFDHKANSFMLDLAQIVFAKDPAVGNIGYKVKFSAGETAKLIHAAGMGSAGESFDVTEAYVSYVAPVGKGLRLDFGKMATFFGAEVIEAIDNPNYSRSFLFNYAIPFTHTGLKAGYAFTDSLNAAVYVVNGWDNATDNNRGKSYGVSVGYAPAEMFSLLVNGMTGPEQDANGPGAPTVGSSSSNKRSLLDLVATVKPMKKLSLILNTDNGRE
ncbi:MAG TPA: outer membrane beta-barrel protein, partial [Nitrospirota bacterium]|nr:outer membrane beta-barrel protein [Nitrospirota bacterium]